MLHMILAMLFGALVTAVCFGAGAWATLPTWIGYVPADVPTFLRGVMVVMAVLVTFAGVGCSSKKKGAGAGAGAGLGEQGLGSGDSLAQYKAGTLGAELRLAMAHYPMAAAASKVASTARPSPAAIS